MRTRIIVLVTLVLSTEALAQNTVAFPHDPYPWCAVYSGDAGGASNCGSHHRAMPGNGERHWWLLRTQSILQSRETVAHTVPASWRRRGSGGPLVSQASGSFKTYAALTPTH